MAPHSLVDDDRHVVSIVERSYPIQNTVKKPVANSTRRSIVSKLKPTPSNEVHDLICVGFGPASLAVAVALHDSINSGKLPGNSASGSPKVLFLEKQQQFAWHAGMLLPGAKMQISFIKDMASLRDPTSKFTFLNYLHENGRLVEFTNLSTFLPARVEYEDYLRWCASSFDDVVRYGSEVISVSPKQRSSGPVSTFTVTSRNVKTGTIVTHTAKNVLFAIGGQASIPKCLPSNNPRVIHSSQYAYLVPRILKQRDAPYRVAVVGAGQSAAEIFSNIQNLYPNSKTTLIMRSEFLKPSDDSPFVNSIFNPSYVDELYQRSSELRHSLLGDARATNYGVVRLELIEHLYERMYDQQRELGKDSKKWPHRILGSSAIAGVEAEGDKLRLRVRPISEVTDREDEIFDCDLVVAATGYQRQAHLTMMEDVADLLPKAPETASAVGSQPGKYDAQIRGRPVKVGRDYGIQFAPGKVSPGSGVWLQGCCEGTHGLSDTLLSILAVRSQEIVDSVFVGHEKQRENVYQAKL
ncbi:L-lysine 6-monooxygenase (NADPH-requiring)-domain-containing protein [Xylaria bambusicola]|uniref:L-lysine 6-monooxygenase (NADPH-requiring)-domain-containing protein n=1 Tax=Xylaria bambusicola TaxID=326684 RepID=UPI00200885FE|nr:L-lysine 6-monooxygenase (NADPH-requiring)-domain-containing protein [Xylaria bambusicola]KAI0505732.1 L-lysine 6-monooxygenase (NADPH-requiring)-domain-containing protein [Xylaria bambusicola]